MALIQTLKFIFTHPLTRNRKFSAFKRWIRWQLGSRILPGGCVVPFVENTRLLVYPGMTGATGNIYTGLHECNDMGFLLHFLRPGDLFVDVGANIGSYTILSCGVIGARTISIEPVPSTYQYLLDNLNLNRLRDNTTCFNVAAGSKKDIIQMIADQDTVNRVINSDNYSGSVIDVSVETLDQLLGRQIPTLIKIDVEGFETEVLRGAKKILRNPRLKAIIIELNGSGQNYGFDEQRLHLDIINSGFTVCKYDVMTRKLTKANDKGSVGNTLYIRDMAEAQDRIDSAKKVSVIGLSL